MSSVKPFRLGSANVLILTPSFYGFATWTITLILYLLRILAWPPPTPTALAVMLTTAVCFLASLLLHRPLYRRWLVGLRKAPLINPYRKYRWLLAVLHLVGFIGLGLYVQHYSAMLGGFTNFTRLLMERSYVIRLATVESESVGTQISYFGWIAIAITVLFIYGKWISKLWLIVAFVQFAGNFLFIGRTRPIWLLITSVTVLAPLARSVGLRRIFIVSGILICTLLTIFVGMGIWVGKISEGIVFERTSNLPPAVQNVYVYITEGYAYLDAVIRYEKPQRGFEGVAYPFYRLLASINLVEEPRSQVNPFYNLPYSGNIGTFLEPFYRDGGIVFTIVGILIGTFGVDSLALVMWRSNHVFGWFAASQLAFCSSMAFMTPKLSSLPVWLFIGFGLWGLLSANTLRGRPAAKREPAPLREFSVR